MNSVDEPLRSERRDKYMSRVKPYMLSRKKLIAADGLYQKNDFPVSIKKQTEILQTFFGLIMKVCVDQGAWYKLPINLGSIGVATSQTNVRRVMDYNYYCKTGEYRFIKPDSGQGKIAKWYWLKRKKRTRFKTPSQIVFKPSRANKKLLASTIKNSNVIDLYYHTNVKY